jgi:structural maintenance of chromosome 3 (chondroitin sulfate proteoglycan 6)
LFHVVVDTEETATHLLNTMSKEKAGRITFIPLNRVKPRTVEYPQKEDAVPLLSQLQFDERYQLAFQQVFGGVILCRTLEVASSYAKSFQLTVVTAEGNRVDGRGAMTGGYIDIKRSKLSAAKKFRQWQVQADAEKERQQQIKQQLLQLDQKVTRLVSALQFVESKKKKLEFLEDTETAEAKLRKEEDLIKSTILQKTRALENIRVHGQLLEKQLVSYQQELATEPTQLLVVEEQQVLKRNAEMLEQLGQKLAETMQQQSQVSSSYERKRG